MAATAPGKPAAPPSNNRYIVLIAGIVGVLGMFQPLMEVGRGKLHIAVSAYELSFGLSRTHKVVDAKIPLLVELKIPADIRSTRDDIKLVLDASKHAALAYIPAALLLLIGVYAMFRKKLGRALGGAALLFGLASIAAYVGLRYGLAYGKEEEPILQRVQLHLALGAHVLLAIGIGAAIAGLASLLKPDR
ncbi:MAG: hypothetical protein HOV81_39010 [Kofleriaceae bacterium]|nr:hypothetical protein [Kofleriaceae bacterium]